MTYLRLQGKWQNRGPSQALLLRPLPSPDLPLAEALSQLWVVGPHRPELREASIVSDRWPDDRNLLGPLPLEAQ